MDRFKHLVVTHEIGIIYPVASPPDPVAEHFLEVVAQHSVEEVDYQLPVTVKVDFGLFVPLLSLPQKPFLASTF